MAREQRNDRLPGRLQMLRRTNDDNPGLNDANRGVSDRYQDKR
ncbi:hypothetical protein ACFFQF_25785 [Haladaptatus pallidirubidus]|nr:hypothetical protein [Haladaptatus pallidirubidus]